MKKILLALLSTIGMFMFATLLALIFVMGTTGIVIGLSIIFVLVFSAMYFVFTQ